MSKRSDLAHRALVLCPPVMLGTELTRGSDINALILDYLTMEGFPKAAANFSKEANLQPQQDNASIQARQKIQNYIHMGEIQNAIDDLNELDVNVRSPRAPVPSMPSPRRDDSNTTCTTHRPKAVDEPNHTENYERPHPLFIDSTQSRLPLRR